MLHGIRYAGKEYEYLPIFYPKLQADGVIHLDLERPKLASKFVHDGQICTLKINLC